VNTLRKTSGLLTIPLLLVFISCGDKKKNESPQNAGMVQQPALPVEALIAKSQSLSANIDTRNYTGQ
jgi:hypothetical protein